MKFYIIGDLHFYHSKIIEYCSRSFTTVEQMNQYMIAKWNETARENDTIYVLGDFGFGNLDQLSEIVKQLNGYKILILGNHDRRRSRSGNWWLRVGFDEVYKNPVEIGNYVFSHEPQEVLDYQINYHAHIHNTPLQPHFNPENHICVSVEMIDYKPLLIEI